MEYEKIKYHQNVTEYNELGMYGSSTIYAQSIEQLKVKRNRLIHKGRIKDGVELLIFGKIVETKERTLEDTDEMFQLTDTITNNRVTDKVKNEAGKRKRFQDRSLKLKSIQKKDKFKSHKRFH